MTFILGMLFAAFRGPLPLIAAGGIARRAWGMLEGGAPDVSAE